MTTKTTRKRTSPDASKKKARAPVEIDSVDELNVADDDNDVDTAPLSSRAIDPLAAEPLTLDEIEIVEHHEPDVAEEDERALQALQQTTEATMPVDAEGEALTEPSADQELEVRRRPRAKDETARERARVAEEDETARPHH